MAIVPDLSGNAPASLPSGVDGSLSGVNRVNAGSPLGALVPLYIGEIVADNTTGQLWYAGGLLNTSWLEYAIAN